MDPTERTKLYKAMQAGRNELAALQIQAADLYAQIAEYKIRPRVDYTREGVAALHLALVASRSVADRVNAADSQMRMLRAQAEVQWQTVDFAYQQVYDALSVETTRADDRHSWEERASRIRTLLIDEAILRKQAELVQLSISGIVDATAIRARSLERAGQDLGRQTDVLRFAHQLGELV